MTRDDVYKAIDSERKFQDQRWGTVEQHPHEIGGWLTIMRKYLTDAEMAWAGRGGDDAAMREVLKVMGVAVACSEQHGIKPRLTHRMMTP